VLRGDKMQRVQVFRCMICGDPYIGFERPTNCPFCGAHEKYMVPSEDWRDTNKVDLTGQSRKNLEASLELEIGNAEFYLCVSKVSRSEEIKAMFKALSKVEAEHATTISKILRIEKPVVEFKKDMCSTDDKATLEEADRRENRAVNLYSEFLKQATEQRVRELFTALIEVESDHIDLVNKEMSAPAEVSKESENPPEKSGLDEFDKDSDFFDSYRLHED
jgi:rubrerythrin